MKTLLGHLYSRIKGSPEDLVTLGLCYILNESTYARQALCNYISTEIGVDFSDIFDFRTQVVGDNNERPDLAGFDKDNNEFLLLEAKFWAGLTENQPIGYLNRLKVNGQSVPKALVFICPNDRLISLWSELLRICTNEGIEYKNENGKRILIIDNVTMSIISWDAVLGILTQVLSTHHSELISDLNQLKGLCDTMDEQAFVPFSQGDFGIDKANRIISYYKIADRIVDKLKCNLEASSVNLKSTPQYAGYDRYLKIRDYGISIKFNCRYWKEYAETPFWLSIKDSHWKYSSEIRKVLKDYENSVPKRLFVKNKSIDLLIPLYVKPNAYEDEIVEDIFEYIKCIFSKLE